MMVGCFFFFNDTATTEIYTLSLHDALPISLEQRLESLLRFRPRQRRRERREAVKEAVGGWQRDVVDEFFRCCDGRSEEHTSELQSRLQLVCRLLAGKKKDK